MSDRDTIPVPRGQRLQWFASSNGDTFAPVGDGNQLNWYAPNNIDGTRQVWFHDDCLGCADSYEEAEQLLALWCHEVLLDLGVLT